MLINNLDLKMKNLFSLLLSMLCAGTMMAQPASNSLNSRAPANGGGFAANSSIIQDFVNRQVGLAGEESNRIAYEKIDGSPYLNKGPVLGDLMLENNNVINDILIEMDLFQEQIIITRENEETMVLDPKFFQEIVIPHDGQQILFRKLNPAEPSTFYELLYEDADISFFKKRYVTMTEGSNNGYSRKDPKFNQRNKYFIKQKKDKVSQIKLKKKDLLECFSTREQKVVEKIAKSQNLKLKDEAEFITLFEKMKETTDN